MKGKKIEWSKFGIYLVAVFMFIACIFLSPNFLTRVNLTNILKQMSVILMAAFGETLLITMGGIDLAVGAEMALSGIISIYVYYATHSLVLSLLRREECILKTYRCAVLYLLNCISSIFDCLYGYVCLIYSSVFII